MNLNNYSIVLLSAGVGRRLGTLGKKYPKCLLKVNNKSLIEFLIKNLRKRNAKNISMIVGYKSKMLINFLKKLKLKRIKINFINANGYKKNGHSYSWLKPTVAISASTHATLKLEQKLFKQVTCMILIPMVIQL